MAGCRITATVSDRDIDYVLLLSEDVSRGWVLSDGVIAVIADNLLGGEVGHHGRTVGVRRDYAILGAARDYRKNGIKHRDCLVLGRMVGAGIGDGPVTNIRLN